MQLEHGFGISALHFRSDAKIEKLSLVDYAVCAGVCRRLRELRTREAQLAGWREQINVRCGETMCRHRNN
jgi:hypothetical protein